MPSVTCFNRSFTPRWYMIVLAVLGIFLCVCLGRWQLSRAAEKEEMLAREAAQRVLAPHLWQSHASALPKPYEAIQVAGRFLPAVILLDNQHHDHQFGYDILSPLVLNKDENTPVLLVDRGFVVGDPLRQSFPRIQTPMTPVSLVGNAYFPGKSTWVLGPSLEKKNSHLVIVERVDIKAIENFLHKPVYPFIMRIGAGEAYGFVRDWPVVAMSPSRHVAYAWQWYAFAGMIFIAFIALNLKKKT